MCSDKENETEGVPADVEDECDEVCIDFDPYTFIKNLPPLKHVVPRWRRSLLPRQTRQCKRKTLVSVCTHPTSHWLLRLSISLSLPTALPCAWTLIFMCSRAGACAGRDLEVAPSAVVA